MATRHEPSELLRGLQDLPDAMRTVLAQRDAIAGIAARHVPSRRYWTVVGNGLNRIAANELRIKLSELCYRSISADIAEDKKHIDLCTEPLIFVCAAGLDGSNADDVAKEVAYHRAHRAVPIVVADDGDERFTGAVEVIHVPPVHRDLGFVLSAMAGHLFGYEAALVIDVSANPLRAARAAVQEAASADDVLATLAASLAAPARTFLDALRAHGYDGNLDASTAVQLASLFRYALGIVAARPVRGRPRQGRHTCRPGRRPHGRAHGRHRRADPHDRHDQAPGEDGHRRHLARRRGAAARAARARGARRGRVA